MDRKKLISEYEQNQQLYVNFVESVTRLLQSLMQYKCIHPQAVQHRAKDIDSLKGNLRGTKYKGKTIKSTSEIVDLAGIRVIFYLERDLKKFRELLFSEFENEEAKNKWSVDGYNGFHFIGSLSKERSKLPEYERFKGLLFEVQLTTVIYHSWNELEHDLIYKDKAGLEKAYPAQYERIKSTAKSMVKDHLIKAQNSWEIIYDQYELAKEGQTIFAKLPSIATSEDNNEIFNDLDRIVTVANQVGELPQNYNIHTTLTNIQELLKNAKNNPHRDESTALGLVRGKTYKDIIELIVKILNQMKFQNVDAVLDFVVDAYNSRDIDLSEALDTFLSETASYHMPTLQKHGYAIQHMIMSKLKALSGDDALSVACSIAPAIFSLDFESTSSSYDRSKDGGIKIHYKTVSLKGDTALKEIRNELLSILTEHLSKSDDLEIQKKVLNALEHAMHFSRLEKESSPLVIENTKYIMNFYKSLLEKASFEVRFLIEVQTKKLRRQFSKDEITEIEEVLALLEADKDYIIYRELIGLPYFCYDSIKFSELSKIKNDRMEEYLKEINTVSWKEKWKELILKAVESQQPLGRHGDFTVLNKLLEQIGANHPSHALEIVKENNSKSKAAFPYLIAGLWDSSSKAEIDAQIDEFIGESQNLLEVSRAIRIHGKFNGPLITRIKDAARSKEMEGDILTYALLASGLNTEMTTQLFVDITSRLAELKDFRWTLNFNGQEEKETNIFQTLNLSEWRRVLKALEESPEVTWHIEKILEILVLKYPSEMVRFFEKRVEKSKLKTHIDHFYHAIPFQLLELAQVLKGKEKQVIDSIFKWISKKELHYNARLLLHALYPGFCQPLKDKINKVIDAKDVKAIKDVFHTIFTWYQGDALTEFVQRVVQKVPKNTELWNTMILYLSNPGMLSGGTNEPIRVKAYKSKLDGLNKWPRKAGKMKDFVKQYKDYLNDRIAVCEKDHHLKLDKLEHEYK